MCYYNFKLLEYIYDAENVITIKDSKNPCLVDIHTFEEIKT